MTVGWLMTPPTHVACTTTGSSGETTIGSTAWIEDDWLSGVSVGAAVGLGDTSGLTVGVPVLAVGSTGTSVGTDVSTWTTVGSGDGSGGFVGESEGTVSASIADAWELSAGVASCAAPVEGAWMSIQKASIAAS
ncbi:MAG: hypothetical protein M3457_20740 [Chloroflexota bacterium]|nr:hypothetical protein [Chloroflexota bacterium]